MQYIVQPQIEHTIRNANSGIQRRGITQMVVGVVLRGSMIIYNNQERVVVEPNRLFIFGEGIHYIELICKDGYYEHIIFPIDAHVLRHELVTMTTNYNFKCSSNHTCPQCRYSNYAVGETSAVVMNFFESIICALDNSDLCSSTAFQRIKLSELLILLLTGDDNCVRKFLVRSANTEKKEFVQVVYNNIFTDVSIKELAQYTNRSVSAFKKDFEANFNTSPHKWILEQRLLRAEMLLRSSSQTLSEICELCIFTNVSHFIRCFKNSYKTTPRAYSNAFRVKQKEESK